MHSKNIHNTPYVFEALIRANINLKPFVFISPKSNKQTIDFSKNEAVYQLNKAILIHNYGLKDWEIPEGYLCPPIPGRADYIHHIYDLLEEKQLLHDVKGLDVGVGANAIFPILGSQMYKWQMVGCDISKAAIISAQKNVGFTPELQQHVEIRHQSNPAHIFEGIIQSGEHFTFSMCNPPFFTSESEASRATTSKFKNLNQAGPVRLNFGGQAHELWCNGGEALFIKRLIKQSVAFKTQVKWFTTLVSRQENLPKFQKQLAKLKVTYKVIEMEQGHKKSRILAWSFTAN